MPSLAEGDGQPDEKLNRELLMFASGFMMVAAMLWLAIYWSFGQRFSSTIPFSYQLISAATFLIYYKTKNFELFRVSQLSLFLFVPFVMQWAIGSFVSSSGVMLWALMAPVGALVTKGVRDSIPWFVAYIVMTVISGVFDFFLADARSIIDLRTVAVFFVLNFVAVSTIVYLLLRRFVKENAQSRAILREQHRLLQSEQDRSERLLLNILPQPIAVRLKAEEKNIADGFADVTVMFADIVNFTQLSEELAPSQMVALLNDIFSDFDRLAEKYGLEKIKTIGDAYMVAGGLDSSGGHEYCDNIADMALEMRDLVANYRPVNGGRLEIRVGIGTGPVVAGVIGMKKFIYDLWGDTVNIASRMTTEGNAGSIQVDVTSYKRLHNRYEFDEMQKIPMKGKGTMQTYRLQAKLTKTPASSQPASKPATAA